MIFVTGNFHLRGLEGLFFYHPRPRSHPVVSIFAWVGYSISRDRHEEAVDMIPGSPIRLNRLRTGVDCFAQQCTNGLGALGKLQMRSKGANGRSHTSFLSSVPPSKWDTWFGGFR